MLRDAVTGAWISAVVCATCVGCGQTGAPGRAEAAPPSASLSDLPAELHAEAALLRLAELGAAPERAQSVALTGDLAVVVWQARGDLVGRIGHAPAIEPGNGVFARVVDPVRERAWPEGELAIHVNAPMGVAGEQVQPRVGAVWAADGARVAFVWQSQGRSA